MCEGIGIGIHNVALQTTTSHHFQKGKQCDRDKTEHLLMRNHRFLFIYYSYMINILSMKNKKKIYRFIIFCLKWL